MHRTDRTDKWLSQIAEAGLSGDQRRLELVLVQIIRSLKKDAPKLSQELGLLLSEHSANPNGLRWKKTGPPPADAEEGLSLIRFESPENCLAPILSQSLSSQINRVIEERKGSARLLVEGFAPPRSLLLIGLPGTGKTMLARWIAEQLGLPFLSLDLATAISSFLGKTGLNLRRVLDYARSQSCLLLLDEFDAIAKRRDDSAELGELKRIVNVLLKELEDWPIQSVLVAATNHPNLLDPAIARRFDVVLELPFPGEAERIAILTRTAGRFSEILTPPFLKGCAHVLTGRSASDVESLMQAAIRQHLANDIPLLESIASELQLRCGPRLGGKSLGMIIRSLQSGSGRRFTVRKLAAMFDKSVSTIQYHLKRR